METVQALLKAGANARLMAKNGSTARELADQNGHDEISKILLASEG